MDHEHVDVLIVGAGLSGIGAACHLQARLPGQDLRDPRGARRDRRHLGPVPLSRASARTPTCSRSATRFRPWDGREGDRRRRRRSCSYIRETAARVRHRRARSASTTGSCAPSGRRDDARWTVDGRAHRHRRDGRSSPAASCSSCTGYYRYDEGYTPEFAGIERFGGQIVHPQHWPEDLDYAGKRVVVIGSGATAVTLVPALAERRRARDDAAALAELHRRRCPARDPIADVAARACCRRRLAYPIVRWKNVLLTTRASTSSAAARPSCVQAADPQGRRAASCRAGYDVDTHFNPRYNPWDQRAVPRARRRPVRGDPRGRRRRSSPTTIETLHRDGHRARRRARSSRPTSIVTATGLNLLPLGGIDARASTARRSTCPRPSPTRA